jgi:lysyl-tRNA synthetase class 2
MWRPSTSIEHLGRRAHYLFKIRQFFQHRGYLEVETPIMSEFGITDVYLSNIKAEFRQKKYSLQTSPEYHMKRLLAAGSGPIFQITKVFRDDELGRWHNPEFTMLEWYQLDIDHHVLMEEVDTLLQLILQTPKAIKKTYAQTFLEILNLDPFNATIPALKEALIPYNLQEVLDAEEQDKDQFLFLLMSHVIEPKLSHYSTPVVIYDFPASQAALAQVNNQVAARFEFYYKGIELANGFHELIDVQAQRERLEEDLRQRAQKQLELPNLDHRFLAALEHGLPECSGVALGIDRLLALALNQDNVSSVLSFDFLRA